MRSSFCKAFGEAFAYEIKSIRASWYKLSLISLLPLLASVLIIAIFKSGVVRDLPVVVVDRDHSKLSKMVLSHIDASPTMQIAYTVNSAKEGIALIQRGKAYALVIIPKHFARDSMLRSHPKITAMLNTQYILIGKILTSALSSTIMHSSAEVEFIQNLTESLHPELALHAISPIGLQITPFFNMYQNYYYFLVSALLPAIWQIFIVIATLVAVGKLFKKGHERDFFKEKKHIPAKLLGLMFPYTLAFMLMGIVYTLYLYSDWAFQGSFTLLFLGMFLTLIAYQFIAYALFATDFDYARSLSLGAVYTAPAFAFLGITFPIYNMNGFALLWRAPLPVSHYTQLQLSQANYGINIWMEGNKLFTLLLFWLIFIPVVLRFKHYFKKTVK